MNEMLFDFHLTHRMRAAAVKAHRPPNREAGKVDGEGQHGTVLPHFRFPVHNRLRKILVRGEIDPLEVLTLHEELDPALQGGMRGGRERRGPWEVAAP